jgi:hypothetical protein
LPKPQWGLIAGESFCGTHVISVLGAQHIFPLPSLGSQQPFSAFLQNSFLHSFFAILAHDFNSLITLP